MQSDADYFRERAGEERRAAQTAATPSIRLLHLEFAQAYELRVKLLAELATEPVADLVAAA